MARRIPTTEEISAALFQAWSASPDPDLPLRLVREVPVPGSVALRGRFHLLTDVDSHAHPATAFATDETTWAEQVRLTEEADAALIRHEVATVHELAERLRATWSAPAHPLPCVDALVAQGDAFRQADDFTKALATYDEALKLARASGYRFGWLRALVSMGHMTLRGGSAEQAALLFTDAEAIAHDLDDRVYRGNALAGRGEALTRQQRFDEGTADLREALALFESIGADGGVISAAQYLGDVHRRLQHLPEARRYLQTALAVAQRSGQRLGLINAADALGEVHLAMDDVPTAVHYLEIALREAQAGQDARGIAHALNGLGRCATRDGDAEHAEVLHREALRLYRALEDPLSASSALDGIARAVHGRGDLKGTSAALLAGVLEVESVRAGQPLHRFQQEFRTRFAPMYANALRAAVAADEPVAFVTVFEALAGQRLARLVDVIADPSDAQVSAQMLARSHRAPTGGTDLDHGTQAATRRARLLGRIALRHGLPQIARADLEDVTAALYRPVTTDHAAQLLRGVGPRYRVVLLTPLPASDDVAVLVAGGNAPPVGMWTVEVPPAVAAQVRAMGEQGLAPSARLGDVEVLTALLPAEVRHSLGDGEPTLLVPLSHLWGLPWPALRVGDGEDRRLGECGPLGVAPSLQVADQAANRPAAPSTRPRTVAHWRSPAVRHHDLLAFTDDTRVTATRLPSASAARQALLQPTYDLVVVAGHGRPLPEVGHFLELTDTDLLTPADLLSADPPALAALVACWGAVAPGQVAGDPLTLATILLARGSRTVLASTSEVADDPVASRFVNDVLYRLPQLSMAEAVHTATVRLLRAPEVRDGYLCRWAPLVTVGPP